VKGIISFYLKKPDIYGNGVFSTCLCHSCEGRNLFFDWNKIPHQVRNDKAEKDENTPLLHLYQTKFISLFDLLIMINFSGYGIKNYLFVLKISNEYPALMDQISLW